VSDQSAGAKPAPAKASNPRQQMVRAALDALYFPQRPQAVFPLGQKVKLYDIAKREIGDRALTYLEFGVHKGWSMSQITRRFPDRWARFIGFDSFEGLPEKWGNLQPGHFSTHGAAPTPEDSRVSFVKGWFQETVHEYLSAHPVPGPVLVHFDADLYSSTLFLMTTLWHHIPEYYFMFDEYVPFEVAAMFDFTRAYPVEFEFFGAVEDERKWPLQVVGRLKKTGLRPQPVAVPDAAS
jgi:hypothetical protein